MASRGHVDCIGCPWEKVEPPKCTGHGAGPSACQQRPDRDRFAKPDHSPFLSEQRVRRNKVLLELHQGSARLLTAVCFMRDLDDQWVKEMIDDIQGHVEGVEGIIRQVEKGS